MVVMNSPEGSLGGFRLVPFHRVLQCEDVLDQHVPARPVPHQHDVVVSVDQAGNRDVALEVDHS